jgi:WD40-like Beta Propeller Repeat
MGNSSARDDTAVASRQRLDSWKEIAAYLNRDIRTVQRWEKQEGLPVHRHQHDERGTAYAYANEIDDWLAARSVRDKEAAASSEPPAMRRSRVAIAAAVAAAAGAILVWALVPRSRPDATLLSSLSIVFAPSERFREWGPDVALSPDGSTIVYSPDGGGLYARRVDQLEGRVLVAGSGFGPFFSPDGRWVGFNRAGQLMRVSIDGGVPVPLHAAAGFMGAADWGPDDHIVYASITEKGQHGLYRLPAKGGTPQLVAALDGRADDAYWLTPQSIANGKAILCTLARAAPSRSHFQVVAVTVATGERRLLVDNARHGLYLGDGVLVYLRDKALLATRLDTSRLEVSGQHVPAWHDVFERMRLRSWASAGGTLVYWPDMRVARRLVWVDRTGHKELLPFPPALYQGPRLSPDGQSIAVGIGGTSEWGDVWKLDVANGTSVQLTSDGRSGTPLWAPDGTRIVFSSLRAVGRDLFQLPLNVTAPPEPIPIPATWLPHAAKEPASWADGGRTLIVRQTGVDPNVSLWAVTLDGSREPRPLLPGHALYSSRVRISPDGRWMAYESGDERADVYVAPFPAGQPQWKVSTGGGWLPVWSRTGRELFYRAGDRMMAVPVTLDGTFTSGTPRTLFEGRYFEADPGSPNYDVTPDGQRFLLVQPGSTEGPDRLNVIQGWKAQILRQLGET